MIVLGRLFNDKQDVKIFTAHRDNIWKYNDLISKVEFNILKPVELNKSNEVVLLINSTTKISIERAKKLFGDQVDIWEINASDIGIDKINNQKELKNFYSVVVSILDEIGHIYGKDKTINLLPAMCNSLAITFGRAIFSKSHNCIKIYDTTKTGEKIVDKLVLTI